MNWTCDQTEERLSDHLDGLLAASERSGFDAHLAGCPRCRTMVAQVSGVLRQVHRLEPLPEPPGLFRKILEQTLGPRKPKKAWLGWLQPVLQPRMAMGFATVVLFGVITLQGLGLQLTQLSWSDLHPGKLYREANRRVHLLYARGEKFVNDLRVVYEIQTRLRSEPEQQPQQKPPTNPQDKPNRESNRLNEPNCRMCVLATGLGGFPSRSVQ